MAVSVALCTHNGERFVVEQLESIFRQSLRVDELVVSDDASRDRTVALIKATLAGQSDAPALTLLENAEPLGVTRNFEQAITACRHDIIVLADQDDVWATDRVAKTLAAFKPGVLLVHSDARLIDAEGTSLGTSLFGVYGVDAATLELEASGGAFEIFLRRNLVTGATAAIRRELALAAAPFPADWVHDEWLAIVAASTGRIVPLADELIDYRQHGGNQIGAVNLTLRSKLARLVAPGRERNRRLLARATALAQRYPGFGTVPGGDEAVREKVEHERARSVLSVHRLARVGPVVHEMRTGRYHRFGGGLQDVARDLIQPLETAS